MFCGLRLVRVSTTKVSQNETGKDEIFFTVSGGTLSRFINRREVRRSGNPDIWEVAPSQPARNIMLWQDFIPENETAILNVEIREQDTFSQQVIGRFNVTINARHPNPTVQWAAASRFTSITGSASGETATISARESGALYQVETVIDKGRRISSLNSDNKCLDVADASLENNANVQQFTDKGGANQRWYIRPAGFRPRPGGSAPFPQSSSGAGEDGVSRSFWFFSIHADHSGKCLDVEIAGSETNVQQFTPNRAQNQEWFLLPAGQPDCFFIISDKDGDGFALDVADASSADNANVQIHPFHGGPNQVWRITPAPLAHSLSGREVADLIR